jgi:alpha-beta hydrolase superfamily lysophospholipase
MGKSFSEAGYGYLTVDMHGHGYSEGIRGLVQSPWDLVDDVLSVLLALYGESTYSSHSGFDDRLLGQQSTVLLRGMAVSGNQPLFLLGHSMGGAVATLAGLALKSSRSAGSVCPVCPTALARSNEAALVRIGKRLGGAVLVAPLVEINAPMAAKPLLEVVSWCCGATPMPAMLVGSGNKDNDKIWASAVYREYCASDAWPKNKEVNSHE